MNIKPVKTRVFKEGENLADFVFQNIPKLKNKSIIVVTSKIAALSEKRTMPQISKRQLEQLIKKESAIAVKSKPVWFTVKDNMVMANAGIDESNGNGRIVLLPKNSFTTAKNLRKELLKKYKIKNLGIIITDSIFLPFRSGITGCSIGYAGFKGLKDHRQTKDIFGRALKLAKTNVVDSISSAAVMLMGEGAQKQPLAIVENTPVEFTSHINPNELDINPKDDIYKPFFKSLKASV